MSGVCAIFIELELAGNVYLSGSFARLKIYSLQVWAIHRFSFLILSSLSYA